MLELIRQYPGETVALVIVCGLLIAAGFGGLMAYWSRSEEQAEMRRATSQPQLRAIQSDPRGDQRGS